jgi:hypothetical protein
VGDVTGIVERLRAVEEQLRDLAYDRLRDADDTGEILAEERRIHQARRAVEKAIRILGGGTAEDD